MAISRDTGSSFPIIAGATGTVSSVTTATFSTSAATTLIVVTVGLANNQGDGWAPPTVAWSGGAPAGASTFTRQTEQHNASFSNHGAAIFTAACTSTVTDKAVVVSGLIESVGATISVMVDALVGASTTMGGVGGSNWDGVGTAPTASMTSVVSGSWIYVAMGAENGATATPVTDTTESDERNYNTSVYSAVGANTTGTSGSVSVGWSNSYTYGAVAALEIKQDTISEFLTANVAQGATLTGTTTFLSNTFSTTGLKTILIPGAYNSFDTGTSDITLAWTGGTPANATALSKVATGSTSYLQTGIWMATTTGDLNNVGVTMTQTGTAGVNDSALLAIYAFGENAGAAGLGTPFYYISNGTNDLPYVTTINTTPGSCVLAVTCTGADEPAYNNPVSGQTVVATAQAPGADWVATAYRIATNGSTSIGWGAGSRSTWQSFIALEYRGNLVPGFPISGFRM